MSITLNTIDDHEFNQIFCSDPSLSRSIILKLENLHAADYDEFSDLADSIKYTELGYKTTLDDLLNVILDLGYTRGIEYIEKYFEPKTECSDYTLSEVFIPEAARRIHSYWVRIALQFYERREIGDIILNEMTNSVNQAIRFLNIYCGSDDVDINKLLNVIQSEAGEEDFNWFREKINDKDNVVSLKADVKTFLENLLDKGLNLSSAVLIPNQYKNKKISVLYWLLNKQGRPLEFVCGKDIPKRLNRKELLELIEFEHCTEVAFEQSIKKEEPKLDDECPICCETSINAIFLNCGHFATCYECACKISERNDPCPICRSHIARVQKVYRS